jgi:hypothetical protein
MVLTYTSSLKNQLARGSMNSQVSEFIQRVENLYEVEYGDFKRKVGLYINHLDQGVSGSQNKALINEMRHAVLYGPIADIEIIRDKTISLAKNIT